MDQSETPLFDALLKYSQNQLYSLHVPGHKDGLSFHPYGKSIYESILRIDGTEVYGLDDLYDPEGAIAKAQDLLTNFYKTVKSYFLVNGSTVGNLAMIKAVCQTGDKVLVQRNSHKSIFNALKLAKVHPVFLSPDLDPATSIALGLNKDLVSQAMENNSTAKALILTYPNYYGMANQDVADIIQLAKQKGLIVLVDEAHGAHFLLGGSVPKSTLEMGADIVIHSAHKTLPAMTMGSYMHINSTDISTRDIENTLEMLQSSSPSYPIMASLDLARAYLAAIDKGRLQKIITKITLFKERLSHIKGLHIVENSMINQDPFKLILASNVDGFTLQSRFQQVGLYPEMADPFHILLTLAIDDNFPQEQVIEAIKHVMNADEIGHLDHKVKVHNKTPQAISQLKIDYGQAERLETEQISLEKSVGHIAAQMVIPYPPGIPVLIDGESIKKDHIEQINSWRQVGARFHGLPSSSKVAMITVYKN